MQKQHPSPHMNLPISIEIYQQLLRASAGSGFEKEAWEIGAVAIRDWMVRNDPDSFAMPATAGYQWKSLFLPNGTLLRTIFNGKNFHCLVEEDHIVYNGQSVSPSGFANAVGGVRRNAWKVIWILFPNSSEWKLAGTLRVKKNTQIPRQFKGQRTGDTPHAKSAARHPEPQRQLEPVPGHGFGSGAPLLHEVGEGDCAPCQLHRPGRPSDEQHCRHGRRRDDPREQRAGQDRRRVQQAVQQQRAREPEPVQDIGAKVPARVSMIPRTDGGREPNLPRAQAWR
jgi:hypothetical protein